MTILITFDTDDDFFLKGKKLKQTTMLHEAFDNKEDAIKFIKSLKVVNLNERHFEPAKLFFNEFKEKSITAIRNHDLITYDGNWEYYVSAVSGVN